MRLRVLDADSQQHALLTLARLAERSVEDPKIVFAARVVTNDCPNRDEGCELEAIFNAVKHGDDRVPGLHRGVRYVADPRSFDLFVAPFRQLAMCEGGACAFDCDDHTSLLMSLGSAIGFRMGARAWGRRPNEFTHVYAVAGTPKRAPREAVGLDSTVENSFVGWEPPGGHTLTVWLD